MRYYCSNPEESKQLDFHRMQRGLQLLVAKTFVKSPTCAQEVVEAFQLESIYTNFGLTKHGDPKHQFFIACIQGNNGSFCIFASKKIMLQIEENILPMNRTYIVDGTFSVVPNGCFKQLLIIHIEYFGKV